MLSIIECIITSEGKDDYHNIICDLKHFFEKKNNSNEKNCNKKIRLLEIERMMTSMIT